MLCVARTRSLLQLSLICHPLGVGEELKLLFRGYGGGRPSKADGCSDTHCSRGVLAFMAGSDGRPRFLSLDISTSVLAQMVSTLLAGCLSRKRGMLCVHTFAHLQPFGRRRGVEAAI